MNKIYRIVWNEVTAAWVAVAEIAKGAHKGGRSARRGRLSAVVRLLLTPLAVALAHMGFAHAAPDGQQLPTGGHVVGGAATITQSTAPNAAVMNINQASTRAAIDWNTFNIGSAAQVNFNQPSASSVTLNRVLDTNPSQIFGKINAPGQVFLSNPSGVVFGPGASVDVGGLVATTHSISTADFMAGGSTFERNGATGSIINEGELKAALGGYIALLAPEVRNNGVIIAQAGTVALASGEAITLNFGENNTLAGITTTKSQIDALVENSNAVLAPGGLIILSAQAMNSLQGGVVNNAGSLEASSLTEKGGKIWLEGDTIALKAGSSANAKGATGGGEVLVGGDWQGSGTLRQATTVTMEEGASIDVSATQNGDGGKAVLWSDIHNPNSFTAAAGAITARGGPQGGNGGNIETSGAQVDFSRATVNAGSDFGKGGEWLIDPDNTYTGGDAVWGSGEQANIQNTLNTGTSVTYEATAGQVTFTPFTISKTGGGDATFKIKSAGYIWLQNGFVIQSSVGKLNVVLWSDTDSAGNGGAVTIGYSGTAQTKILTNGGNITIGGGSNPATGYSKAGDSLWQGVLLYNAKLDAQGGNISIRGQSSYPTTGSYGVYISGSTVATSGTGNISIIGNQSTAYNSGIYVENSANFNSSLSLGSGSGTLTLNGTGGATGAPINWVSGTTTATGTDSTIALTLDDDWTLNSGINGSGTLSVSEAAAKTLTIGSSRSFSGVTVNAGTLTYGANNLFADTANVTVNSNGTLNLATYDDTIGGLTGSGSVVVGTGSILTVDTTLGSSAFSGVISGAGGLATTGNYSTLTLSGNNTYTGTTTIGSNSWLLAGNGGTTGKLGTGAVTNSGNLVFNRSDALTVSNTISGSGVVKQEGSSTLTLSGNNSYTGGTIFYAGALNLGSANAIGTSGTLSFTGGTLQYSASNTTDYSSRFSNAINQQYEIDTNGQSVTLASALTSSGGTFTKLGGGTLTLSGNPLGQPDVRRYRGAGGQLGHDR